MGGPKGDKFLRGRLPWAFRWARSGPPGPYRGEPLRKGCDRLRYVGFGMLGAAASGPAARGIVGTTSAEDFGTLTGWSAGLTWAPTGKLGFQAIAFGLERRLPAASNEKPRGVFGDP